ncbi:hypothetical protein NMG60_11014435 [Bertholletia excelsa]
MEPATGKSILLSNVLLRVFAFGVLVFLARFAYIVVPTGNSCNSGDYCLFSSVSTNLKFDTVRSRDAASAGDWDSPISTTDSSLRSFYSSVFQDLIAEGYLSPHSKALCIETLTGEEVAALREIGVSDSVGMSAKLWPGMAISSPALGHPFTENTFDFEFVGDGALDRSARPAKFASEVARTLKPGGFVVVHTAKKDLYNINSLLDLFDCCKLVRSRDIAGLNTLMPSVREIVLIKDNKILDHGERERSLRCNSVNKFNVSGYKQELIRNAEPLIAEEPLKPWITLKLNTKNIRYLPSMVDISFKDRYVYIDVGARSYGSSIGSWFRRLYPKQNKDFEIYAIEADKAFHDEYRTKKGVTLLPYAAWVRNETLFFEITREPTQKNVERGRAMGRIHPAQSSSNFVGDLDKIQGIDFANWLKSTFSKKDFVVMKMDIEGTEFYLIPKMIETGAICLIDEFFLECHYNRWQRCCPGQRSSKFEKTYSECLDLLSSLRKNGVLVHQWF